jgi:hypothetical protein
VRVCMCVCACTYCVCARFALLCFALLCFALLCFALLCFSLLACLLASLCTPLPGVGVGPGGVQECMHLPSPPPFWMCVHSMPCMHGRHSTGEKKGK